MFWPFAYDISIVVNMHKSTLRTLTRVLLTPLNFIFSLHVIALCDLDPRILILICAYFDFTSFDLIIERVLNITYVLLFYSHGILLGLVTMRPFSCTYTDLLLFVDWTWFNFFIISYQHLTECTPIYMTCNNFYRFISLFACLFS